MRYPGIKNSVYRLISFYTRVKPVLAALLFFSVATGLPADTSILAKGEQLFLENRLEEALPLLETAALQNPENERIYLYLGSIYEQLGEYAKAVQILQKGTLVAQQHLDLIYFNIGNNLFKQDKLVLAEEMYSRSVEQNPRLSDVYLNRANTRVKTGLFMQAVDDYRIYLNLQPGTPQRGNIERMIALLTEEIAQEQARQRAEEERQAAEAARQKALLNDVLNSLQKAVEETKSISVETEGIEEVEEEADIVD